MYFLLQKSQRTSWDLWSESKDSISFFPKEIKAFSTLSLLQLQ